MALQLPGHSMFAPPGALPPAGSVGIMPPMTGGIGSILAGTGAMNAQQQPPQGIMGRMGQGLQNIMQPAEGGGMKPGMMAALYGLNLLSQPRSANAFSNALGGTMGMVNNMQANKIRQQESEFRKEAFETQRQTRKDVQAMATKSADRYRKIAMEDGTMSPQEQAALELFELAAATGDQRVLMEASQVLPGFKRVGQYNPRDYTSDSWTNFAQTGFADPSVLKRYEPYKIQMVNGVPTLVSTVPTAGGVGPDAAGATAPLTTPQAEGTGRGEVDAAEAAAEAAAAAGRELPDAYSDLLETEKRVNELLAHPGLPKAVGWQSMFPTRPGSDAANFEARLEQLSGSVFSEAYQTLKGGGSITVIETQKAEAALARLQTSQSDKEFKQSLQDFKDAVRKGYDKLRRKAGGTQPPAGQTLTSPGGVSYEVVQ